MFFPIFVWSMDPATRFLNVRGLEGAAPVPGDSAGASRGGTGAHDRGAAGAGAGAVWTKKSAGEKVRCSC